MDIAALQERLRAFAAERGWAPFHTPKNLATALLVEAAELVEIFQWQTPEQSLDVSGDAIEREKVGDEAADVILYLAQLADATGIDLEACVERKLAKNALKHPPTAPGAPASARRGPERKVHVLVDWENVQPKEGDIRALVDGATDLWLFHGPQQRHVGEHHAGFGVRATPVRISRTGKNALDFHLAFYMGYIAARHPDARFVVVSNDNGYKPMLEHAAELGFDTVSLGFRRGRAAAPGAAVGTATRRGTAKRAAKAAPAQPAGASAKKAAKKATRATSKSAVKTAARSASLPEGIDGPLPAMGEERSLRTDQLAATASAGRTAPETGERATAETGGRPARKTGDRSGARSGRRGAAKTGRGTAAQTEEPAAETQDAQTAAPPDERAGETTRGRNGATRRGRTREATAERSGATAHEATGATRRTRTREGTAEASSATTGETTGVTTRRRSGQPTTERSSVTAGETSGATRRGRTRETPAERSRATGETTGAAPAERGGEATDGRTRETARKRPGATAAQTAGATESQAGAATGERAAAKATRTRAPRAAKKAVQPAVEADRAQAAFEAAIQSDDAVAAGNRPAVRGRPVDPSALAARIDEQLRAMTEGQRPVRRMSLLRMIGSRLPTGTDEAARLAVLERLVATGAVAVDARGAVHYPGGVT